MPVLVLEQRDVLGGLHSTDEIAPGSVRARGTTGGFSQFLVLTDVRETGAVVQDKFDWLRARIEAVPATDGVRSQDQVDRGGSLQVEGQPPPSTQKQVEPCGNRVADAFARRAIDSQHRGTQVAGQFERLVQRQRTFGPVGHGYENQSHIGVLS